MFPLPYKDVNALDGQLHLQAAARPPLARVEAQEVIVPGKRRLLKSAIHLVEGGEDILQMWRNENWLSSKEGVIL